jgi:hypothetical protein
MAGGKANVYKQNRRKTSEMNVAEAFEEFEEEFAEFLGWIGGDFGMLAVLTVDVKGIWGRNRGNRGNWSHGEEEVDFIQWSWRCVDECQLGG